MNRRIGGLLVILLLVIILLLFVREAWQTAGILGPTQESLTSQPDFVGWVLGVDLDSNQIRVESQADKIVHPVTASLTKDTLIFRREAGVLRQVDVSEIHIRDQAELWLVGPVPSSFPAEVIVRQVIVDKLY